MLQLKRKIFQIPVFWKKAQQFWSKETNVTAA